MDSQWLQTQFQLNPGKSKAGLAKALGLEPPAVSKILNGGRQIKAQEYHAMRRFFGLPIDGERAVHGNAYSLSPLDGQEGLHESDKMAAEWVIPAEILSTRTRTPPEQIRIFQIRENVMEPDFRHGEYVIVDLSDQKPSPPGVFIISDGFGHMVRLCAYLPKSQPAKVKIAAINQNFEAQILEEDDFTLVGRVIAKLQWL